METATYGPFRGFANSVPRDMVPRDRITNGPANSRSANVLINPLAGSLTPRLGTAIEGDTAATPAGLTEKKYASRVRHMFALSSPSASGGYEFPAALITNESATGKGTLYWRDLDTPANMQLGIDFGSGHYPRDAGNAKVEFVMPPLKVDPVAGLNGASNREYTRACDYVQRAWMTPGARRSVQMGDYLFLGNYRGTPARWNRRYNPDGTNGDETMRYRLWGNYPPPWMPTLTQSATGSGWNAASATVAGKFAYSVMFHHKDGSFSMPVVPRTAYVSGGKTLGNYGVFTVTTNSDKITWSDIPVGDDTVDARYLLRSLQVISTAIPDLSTLGICGALFNNTQTTYEDTNFSDTANALVFDPIKIRFDHVLPWRHRYAFVADERVFIGYLRPNPTAFLITRYKSNAGTAQNVADVDTYTSTEWTSGIREDQTAAKVVQLVLSEAGVEDVYALATYTTLRFLVDAVNDDEAKANAGSWRANVAPGADGSAATSNLDITQLLIPTETVSGSPNITPGAGKDFTNVKNGMRAKGTNIPANTYVKTNVAGTIALCDIDGAAVNATGSTSGTPVTITFGWETGDTTPGAFRAFGGSFQTPHYWNETYLDTFGEKPRALMFTSGEPGHARNAANNFYATIAQLEPSIEAGAFMGGAGLKGNPGLIGIACFSKAIYRIENPRGGNTALDTDIRLRPLNLARGCISPYGIVSGDGWVGYPTEDGFVVTDGEEERVISRDIWNVADTARGELGTSIQDCRNEVGGNTDAANIHALVVQGRLLLTYRSAASSNDRMIAYDFSPGLAGSGLAEVTLGPNQSYGWSAPLSGATTGAGRWLPYAMCVVRRSNALHYYFWDESNPGTTGDGILKRLFKPSTFTDDGVSYAASFYCCTDRFGNTLKKSAHDFRVLFLQDNGSGAWAYKLFRGPSDATGTTIYTMTGATSGLPVRAIRPLPIALRDASDCYAIGATATVAEQDATLSMELDYEDLMGSGL